MKLIFLIHKIPDDGVTKFERFQKWKKAVVNIPWLHYRKPTMSKTEFYESSYHYMICFTESLEGINKECGWRPYYLRKL